MKRIKIIRGICFLMPPLISQRIRAALISMKTNPEKGEFRRKAFLGGEFIGNFKDFHSFRFYIHGYFEWRNIVLAYKIQKIKKGDIIEVGANVGTETISLVKIAEKKLVHAFEPVEENFYYLKANKNHNKFSNLLLYQNLVSDRPGTALFKKPDLDNSGSGHITTEEGKRTVKYNVVTLDDQLSLIRSCSLIIIDVEGFELNVLRGGRNIISRFKPYLIMEVNPSFLKERVNISMPDFYQELQEMGYESFYIEKRKIEKVEIKKLKKKSNKNWICIPREDLQYQKQLSCSLNWNALNPIINFKIF